MMNLEDELARVMSEEIAKEIDSEVLFGVYKELGWQAVVLDSLGSRKRSIDILEWCAIHCNGHYHNSGRKFVFEDSKDALLFILAWNS